MVLFIFPRHQIPQGFGLSVLDTDSEKNASVQQGRLSKKHLGTKPKLNSKGKTVTTERNQEPDNVFSELKLECEQTTKCWPRITIGCNREMLKPDIIFYTDIKMASSLSNIKLSSLLLAQHSGLNRSLKSCSSKDSIQNETRIVLSLFAIASPLG